MRLEHTFTVPVSVDEAFKVLRDIERIAPCMPGATLGEVNDAQFTGTVKVKVGPISMQFQGTGMFVDVDEDQHIATIEASGREARGSGTARATIRAELQERGDRETEVNVVTDLVITGRVAQFGRGVMSDVGAKLLGQFADCLSEELGRQPEAAPAPAQDAPPDAAEAALAPAQDAPPEAAEAAEEPDPASSSEPAETPAAATTSPTWPTEDAVDLLDVAGTPLLKRVLPVICAVVAVAVIIRLVRRNSR